MDEPSNIPAPALVPNTAALPVPDAKSDLDLLRALTAKRETLCPWCSRPLGDLKSEQCPACRVSLTLAIRRDRMRPALFLILFALLGWVLGTGIQNSTQQVMSISRQVQYKKANAQVQIEVRERLLASERESLASLEKSRIDFENRELSKPSGTVLPAEAIEYVIAAMEHQIAEARAHISEDERALAMLSSPVLTTLGEYSLPVLIDLAWIALLTLLGFIGLPWLLLARRKSTRANPNTERRLIRFAAASFLLYMGMHVFLFIWQVVI